MRIGSFLITPLNQGPGRQKILEDIQKPSEHSPGQWALGGHAGAGRLDQMASRGPWQPQPFCDSVILKLCRP